MEHCGAKFVNKLGLGTEESNWIFIFYFTYRIIMPIGLFGMVWSKFRNR